MAERDYWPPVSDPEHPDHEQWKQRMAEAVVSEQVNHPAHYGGDTPYEVIKVLEAWDPLMTYHGCIFNVHKYLARAGKKGDVKEDIEKASWYAQKAAELLTRHPELLRVTERKEDPKKASSPPSYTYDR